jgi:hypothetical protein
MATTAMIKITSSAIILAVLVWTVSLNMAHADQWFDRWSDQMQRQLDQQNEQFERQQEQYDRQRDRDNFGYRTDDDD